MKPRLVLADDHSLLLEALERLLAKDFDIVGRAIDGHALLAIAAQERPDVVVVDVMMPHLNGLDAARELRRTQPEVAIVFLTMVEDPEIAAEAVRLGACGYVLKRSAASELVTAVQQTLQRHAYVTPLITTEVIGALLNGNHDSRGRAQLTQRQREILQLLAEGHSMKQVASMLKLAPRTVAFHKYRMMAQLQIKTSAGLVQFAVKHHLVA